MNETFQQIAALFIVALTILILVRKKKSSSCGGGCHCDKHKVNLTQPPQNP